MARLSASVSEATKDALYAAAKRDGVAVSHIVQAALDSYLESGTPTPVGGGNDSAALHNLRGQVQELSSQIADLRKDLTAPARGQRPRYF